MNMEAGVKIKSYPATMALTNSVVGEFITGRAVTYPRVGEYTSPPQESNIGAKCCTGLPSIRSENYFDWTDKKQQA